MIYHTTLYYIILHCIRLEYIVVHYITLNYIRYFIIYYIIARSVPRVFYKTHHNRPKHNGTHTKKNKWKKQRTYMLWHGVTTYLRFLKSLMKIGKPPQHRNLRAHLPETTAKNYGQIYFQLPPGYSNVDVFKYQ